MQTCFFLQQTEAIRENHNKSICRTVVSILHLLYKSCTNYCWRGCWKILRPRRSGVLLWDCHLVMPKETSINFHWYACLSMSWRSITTIKWENPTISQPYTKTKVKQRILIVDSLPPKKAIPLNGQPRNYTYK